MCIHESIPSPLQNITEERYTPHRSFNHACEELPSEAPSHWAKVITRSVVKVKTTSQKCCRLPTPRHPPANEGMGELKEIKEWQAHSKKGTSRSWPCTEWLSCTAKPFCHLLIRTERSRGTETKRQGRTRSHGMKREDVGVRKPGEREGETGMDARCFFFFSF